MHSEHNTPTAAPDEAAAFLAARFPRLDEGETIEIRPIEGATVKGRRWFQSAEEAARYAVGFNGRHDIYYGINPRRGRGGTKAQIARVTQVHLDVDFKHYADGREGALAAIDRFPLAPTYAVESGGGFQLGFDLAEPIHGEGATAPAVARVEGLIRRLQVHFGGLDATQDVSRIFRVPGTTNHKYDPPRPVRLLWSHPERRYRLEEFEALLPEPRPAAERATGQGGDSLPAGDRSGAGDVPTPGEIAEWLSYIPKQGAYDTWLCCLMAIHSVYPDQTGIDLIEAWSPGHEGEVAEKFRSFKRTGVGIGSLVHLAKAHGWQPPTFTVRLHGRPLGEPPAPETDDHDKMGIEQLRQENARLRAEVAALREDVRDLLHQRNEERDRFRRKLLVLRNSTLRPSTRLAVVGLADVLEAAERAGGTQEDGWRPVFLAAVADRAALNERSVGAEVQHIAELQLIDKETTAPKAVRKKLPNGREHRVLCSELRVRATAAELIDRAAAIRAPGRNHGGPRELKRWRCPDHPDAIHRATCGACGQTGTDVPREPARPGADEPAAPCDAQVASHTPDSSSGAGDARPVEVPGIPVTQLASHNPSADASPPATGAERERADDLGERLTALYERCARGDGLPATAPPAPSTPLCERCAEAPVPIEGMWCLPCLDAEPGRDAPPQPPPERYSPVALLDGGGR